MATSIVRIEDMDFAHRLTILRKQRGLTQAVLAERVGVHPSQLRRYESGGSQPSLEVLRKMALALAVSADVLLFDEDERGPSEGLRLHLEAASNLDDDEQAVVRSVIEGLMLKHEARRVHVLSPQGSGAA